MLEKSCVTVRNEYYVIDIMMSVLPALLFFQWKRCELKTCVHKTVTCSM